MKVAMLAAGVGLRLDPNGLAPPKALLRFGDETLLQRHLDILRHFALTDVTLVVGHRATTIEGELAELATPETVRTVFNPDYRTSSLLSLWALREELRAGQPVLYMDADVLYDFRLLARLLETPHPNCLLIDRRNRPGEDPLKVCMRAGRVVDFHKRIRAPSYDYWAEWVGFARFSAEMAERLAAAVAAYVRAGRVDAIYEEPIRDVILSAEPEQFAVVDITGLPWTEIDFPDDLARARSEIYPRLRPLRDALSRSDRAPLGPARRALPG